MRFFALPLVGLGLMGLAGCTTLSQAINTFGTITGTSISSGRAVTYDDALRTLQDTAGAYLNGCVAARSVTGVCAYGDQVYNDLLVVRADRKALLSYATSHSSIPIGIGGVLALTVTAVQNLQEVLANAGVVTPAIAP